jgi:hypothetical protein
LKSKRPAHFGQTTCGPIGYTDDGQHLTADKPAAPTTRAPSYGYTDTYNSVTAALGIKKDCLTVTSYVENLFDNHSFIYVHPEEFISSRYGILRPRTRASGTFTGEMIKPGGKAIAPTGKAFDVEFGQTTKWDGDQLIVISASWDSAMQAQQIGLA